MKLNEICVTFQKTWNNAQTSEEKQNIKRIAENYFKYRKNHYKLMHDNSDLTIKNVVK
jgi:uncharacterized membrane protein (DUF106 family)